MLQNQANKQVMWKNIGHMLECITIKLTIFTIITRSSSNTSQFRQQSPWHLAIKIGFFNVIRGPSLQDFVCFNGEKVQLNITTNNTKSPPIGMCLEKSDAVHTLTLWVTLKGRTRLFFSNQKGRIWLATIPKIESSRGLDLDDSNPFLDFTYEIYFDTQFGLMLIALHPNFVQNGRLFGSFNCDKSKNPSSSRMCACNSDVNCNPSKLRLLQNIFIKQDGRINLRCFLYLKSVFFLQILLASLVETKSICTMDLLFTSCSLNKSSKVKEIRVHI